MRTLFTACGIAAASLACAQASGIGGPVTGYVMDGRGQALRPIEGIPGAARLGGPVSLPFAINMAVVATQQDYAIVTEAGGEGRPMLARGLRSGAPQVRAIDGAIAASGMVLSRSGAVAAFYSNATKQLQFVTGLPEAPQAQDAIDISALEGDVQALALDAAGENALLAAADGGIYRAAGKGARGVNWIARTAGAASIAFLPNGDDAVVGSRATGDVLLLHGLSGSLSIRTVGGANNGITSARAVHAISDREVAVVDGAAGGLAAIDLDSGSTEWIALAGAAERFEALDGNLLLLNGVGPRPLLLLDTTHGRTPYFVPADRTSGLRRK
jgi:hypothetical protein